MTVRVVRFRVVTAFSIGRLLKLMLLWLGLPAGLLGARLLPPADPAALLVQAWAVAGAATLAANAAGLIPVRARRRVPLD